MKATGIIRRIDDLGRVVIPKEIRRAMKIREGDPLEIYTDSTGGVTFRKYFPHKQITEEIKIVHKSLAANGVGCAFYDNNGDKIVGSSKMPTTIDIDDYDSNSLVEIKDAESLDTMCYILCDKNVTESQKALVKMGAQILNIKTEV